jgi:hypothetical protein
MNLSFDLLVIGIEGVACIFAVWGLKSCIGIIRMCKTDQKFTRIEK